MTAQWVKAALVRAIKTAAQTALALVGASSVLSDVDWGVTLSTVAVAALLSILTSFAGLPEVEPDPLDEVV